MSKVATSVKKLTNSYSLLTRKMDKVHETKKKVPPKSSSNSKPCEKVCGRDKTNSMSGCERNIIEITIDDNDNPDRSYGDYFCKICDSHMNSSGMWEAHVTGKRHIKNVKKGDTDSKYEDLNEESYIKNEIKNVKDPVLGLSYIHEIRRRELGFPAMYNCFLCHASIATVPLVIEHVTGVKHQLNFMRENDPDEHKLIEAMNLKKGLIEPVILEVASKLEEKYGRGTVQVKLEKPATTSSYKRKWEENEDKKDGYQKPFKNAYKSDEVKSRDSYKSSDTSRRDSEIYRREMDRDMRCHNSPKSPQSPLLRPSYIFGKHESTRERISPEQDNRQNSYSKSSEHDNYSRRSNIPTHSIPDHRKSDSCSSSLHPQPRLVFLKKLKVRNQRGSYQTLDNILSRPSYIEPIKIEPPKDSGNMFKDFVSQIVALPPDLFFKIVLMKLDTIELRGINELEMLSKIIVKASNVRRKNLPSDVQEILKLSTNSNEKDLKLSSTVPNLPPQDLSTCAQNMNSDMGFNLHNPQAQQAFDVRATVNELVFGRKEVESAAMNQQAHSSNFNNTNIAAPASQMYQKTGAPSHTPVFTSSDTSPLPQMPNYWPSVNIPPRSHHRPSFPSSFTNVLASDSNYQNHLSSSFTKPTSIPGLTLAENDSPQSKPSEYASQFKWSRVTPREIYSFKRY